ncbi:MAG: cob(I)yrinic acid a,c-diamide adenosyltransferase [Armatimonadetes bacterium]|nr:cob(I)yrinic acid a,c-diamide adenosyltransferase [Armatimonadota bacterium]
MIKAESGKGFIQVFYGHGKGKTAAALGYVMRAAGHGLSAYVVQFLKADKRSGEFQLAEQVLSNVKMEAFGRRCPYMDLLRQGLIQCEECRECFVKPKKVLQLDRELALMALDTVRDCFKTARFDIIVLDEVLLALEYRLVSAQDLVELLAHKPEGVELILTGPDAPQEILEMADRASLLEEVKSPRKAGAKSRAGLDY